MTTCGPLMTGCWWERAELREGRERISRSLALVSDENAPAHWVRFAKVMTPGFGPAALVRALEGSGVLHVVMGDAERGLRLLEAATALARMTEGPLLLVHLLNWYGNCSFFLSDFSSARRAYEEALACARTGGDLLAIATALGNLSVFHLIDGDVVLAIRENQQAQQMAERDPAGYLLGAAQVTSSLVDALRDPLVTRARHRLPAIAYHAAWDQGWRLSIEDALSQAIAVVQR